MKTVIDIENASAGALKKDKEAAIEIAKATEVDVLAPRYVQARLDATTRDELLADQGDTITTIKRALAEKTELATRAMTDLNKAESSLVSLRSASETDAIAHADAIEAITLKADADLDAMQLKASDALTDLAGKTELAKRRRAALAEVADTAAQAIADIAAVTNRLLAEE